MAALLIHHLLAYGTVLDKLAHRLVIKHIALRHFKVKPSVQGAHGGIGRGPVRHYYTLVAPSAQLVQQPAVFGSMHSVHRIVAGHYGTHARLLYGLAEGREIDFVDSTLVGKRSRTVTVVLLIIEGKVLDGSDYPLLLNAAYVLDRGLGGKVGVFSVVLEVAAAKG